MHSHDRHAMPRRSALAPAGALLALFAVSGCKGDNWAKGEVAGAEIPEIREAIFEGDVGGDGEITSLRVLMSTYDNACQNFQSYVQLQEYDADNALLDEVNADPRYLLFTIVLAEGEVFATHEVLAPGETYDDGISSVSGRYRWADGEGSFDEAVMSSGALTLAEVDEEGLLRGSFEVSFDGSDSAEGELAATECDP